MVYVATEIEIARTPEQVREVFLDWPAYPEWSKTNIRTIKPVDNKKPIEIVAGDKVKVGFDGMKTTVEVTDNSPEKFGWKGSWWGLLTASHTFRFEPSKTTPGHTTFYNAEEFHGLIGDLSKSTSEGGGGFGKFNASFKERVESVMPDLQKA